MLFCLVSPRAVAAGSAASTTVARAPCDGRGGAGRAAPTQAVGLLATAARWLAGGGRDGWSRRSTRVMPDVARGETRRPGQDGRGRGGGGSTFASPHVVSAPRGGHPQPGRGGFSPKTFQDVSSTGSASSRHFQEYCPRHSPTPNSLLSVTLCERRPLNRVRICFP